MFSRLHWEKFGIYRKNSQKREFWATLRTLGLIQKLLPYAVLGIYSYFGTP